MEPCSNTIGMVYERDRLPLLVDAAMKPLAAILEDIILEEMKRRDVIVITTLGEDTAVGSLDE